MRWDLQKLPLPCWFIWNRKHEGMRGSIHLKNKLTKGRIERLFLLTRRVPLHFNDKQTLDWMLSNDVGPTKYGVRADLDAHFDQRSFSDPCALSLVWPVLSTIRTLHRVNITINNRLCAI